MTRVEAAFFSITPALWEGDRDAYYRWHFLDHMPEQYRLPGLVGATRWVADGDLLDAAIVGVDHLRRIGSIVNYLVGAPVQETHDEFFELGRRLAEQGRYPAERPPVVELDFVAVTSRHDDVAPFRPHRGVVVVVEEPTPRSDPDDVAPLLATDGVAGVWTYASSDAWRANPRCEQRPRQITVVYLDADPLTTSAGIAPLLRERWHSGALRPLFAGPLRSMIRWESIDG